MTLPSCGTGLHNLGASCFINAGIQSLLAIPELSLCIERGVSPAEAAIKAVLSMMASKASPITPQPLTDMFYAGQQADAAEFLLGLLEACPSLQASLQGEECPKLRCQHCDYSRPLTEDKFLSLQLPLMVTRPVSSVQEALDSYVNAEHIQEGADWFCCNEDCLNSGHALDAPIHQTRMLKWPSVLVVCLKRWDSAHGLLSHPVYCNQTLMADGHAYQLASLITHIGAAPTAGHYVAYRRAEHDFLRLDDARVTPFDGGAGFFSSVPNEKVYMLTYVKEQRVQDTARLDPRHDDEDERRPPIKRAAIELDDDPDHVPDGEDPNDLQPDTDSDVIPLHEEVGKRPAKHHINRDGIMEIDLDSEETPVEEQSLDDGNINEESGNPPTSQGITDVHLVRVPPAKRLAAFGNYEPQHRERIGDILRNSATLEDAIEEMRQSVPNFTCKNVTSPTYLSRRLLKSWFENRSALNKAMKIGPPKEVNPKKVARVTSGTTRANLSEEVKEKIADALDRATSAGEVATVLAQTLPGFSTDNKNASNYIPRGTLHSWHRRPNVLAPLNLPTSWEEEHRLHFSITTAKPCKRTVAPLAADDTNGLWFQHGSWTFCPKCGRHRAQANHSKGSPKQATPCFPACDWDARALLAPPQKKLTVVGKLEGYITPALRHWQSWTDYIGNGDLPFSSILPQDELRNLAVVDIKVTYRSRRGGNADICSMQKRTVVRCRWRAESLMELRRGDVAARCFQWLLDNNDTYAKYVKLHHDMVTQAHTDESWRELTTAELLLRSPGIEVAARPWLYPLASYADTDISERLRTLGWTSASQKPSIRASFLRKLSSRCIEYGRDFALNCLLYDICMAKTISSVLNIAHQKHAAPERISSDMDIFEGYWFQQLRKMEDICRQEFEVSHDMSKALPNVFLTVAPAEWKYILHDGLFFEDSLSNQQQLLTLHLHSSLASMLEMHLFKEGKSLAQVGISKVRQWSLRFEFESRGTLHVHVVMWADLMEGWHAEHLCGRSNTDKSSALLKLLENLFKSRADVQCGDGSHVLLKYVAGYLTKASDALQFHAKQAQDSGSHGGEWRQTYRLLSKRSPMEQEITMEFAGLPMVKHSFSGLDMFAPIPGSKAKNAARRRYDVYQFYLTQSPQTFGCAQHMTFIQWLRKFRLASTQETDFTVLPRNQAGPAAGKSCGVAMSFPFELLDIYVGAWAASCLPDMLEIRLIPNLISEDGYPEEHKNELLRRRAFDAPDGCRRLKAILCLDHFQVAGAPAEQFAPDIGKLLSQMEVELTFRGLGQDRIATFKARIHACTLLLKKIYEGQEDAGLWNTRRLDSAPVRQWSPEQAAVLEQIRQGTQVSNAADLESASRVLQVIGGPGTGKTEVIIAAARQALEDKCSVLIAGPIGLLVSMYRQDTHAKCVDSDSLYLRTCLVRRLRLPADENLVMETIHSAFHITREADAPYIPPGRLRKFDLIIFDEVSQIDTSTWAKLKIALAELTPTPYVVFVGDFQQLQPVGGISKLQEDLLRQKGKDVMTIELKHHEAARSTDPEMLAFLEKIRVKQPSREELQDFFRDRMWSSDPEAAVRTARRLEQEKGKPFTFLTVTNAGADKLNRARLAQEFPEAAQALAQGGGIPAEIGEVVLAAGMRLRLTHNVDKDRGFVNGNTGTVRSVLRKDIVIFQSSQGSLILVHPITVKGKKFLPVTYGWCTTMRRAQGATLNHVALWMDRRLPDKGYAYVGTSRARHRADVYLMGRVRRTDWRPVGPDRPEDQHQLSALSESTDPEEEASMTSMSSESAEPDFSSLSSETS